MGKYRPSTMILNTFSQDHSQELCNCIEIQRCQMVLALSFILSSTSLLVAVLAAANKEVRFNQTI